MKALAEPNMLQDEDAARGSRRETTVSSLYVVVFLHVFCIFLSFDSKMLIYLKHFKGETAKYALVNAKAMAIMMGSSLILQPWLTSFCEAYGRKSLIALSAASNILARIADTLVPIPRVIFLTTATSALAGGAMIGVQSMIGDLFTGDHQGIGGANARMMIGPAAAAVVAPTLGSSLAARGVRLPFILAIVGGIMEIALIGKLPETLVPSERIPFKDMDFGRLNPFNFLKIFCRGPRLASLAFGHFLTECTAPPLVARTVNLVYQESLHWNLAAVGRYSSIQNIIRIPGMALGGRVVKAVGEAKALLCGHSAIILHIILDSSFVRTSFRQYITSPLVALNGLTVASLKGLVQQAAADVGMRQAELQGCLSALQSIAMMIGGPLWAAWYAACLKKGQPRHFFHGTMLFVVLQAIVCQVAARLPRPAASISEPGKGEQR